MELSGSNIIVVLECTNCSRYEVVSEERRKELGGVEEKEA
jgi:hypothetical protein